MQPNDRQKLYGALTGVFELYGKNASPDLFALYYEALKAYSLDDILRALNLHAVDPDQGQFCPKPADLVRAIGGTKQSRALSAWSQVDRAVRQVGPYHSVVFDDPIIQVVLEDMGGWIDICSTPTEKDFDFKAIEFKTRYQGYAIQGGAQEFPAKLIGLTEADCVRIDKPELKPKPVLIGDAQEASKVLALGRSGPKPITQGLPGIMANLKLEKLQ